MNTDEHTFPFVPTAGLPKSWYLMRHFVSKTLSHAYRRGTKVGGIFIQDLRWFVNPGHSQAQLLACGVFRVDRIDNLAAIHDCNAVGQRKNFIQLG